MERQMQVHLYFIGEMYLIQSRKTGMPFELMKNPEKSNKGRMISGAPCSMRSQAQRYTAKTAHTRQVDVRQVSRLIHTTPITSVAGKRDI